MWVLGGVGLVGIYLISGFIYAPMLLAPIGCSPTDQAVGYAPATSFNISYAAETSDLKVTQTGGDTLPAERTDAPLVRLYTTDSQVVRNYTWTDVGGQYPVRIGDSVTVQNPTVDGRPLADGDVVRVIWSGTRGAPTPITVLMKAIRPGWRHFPNW